MIDLEKYEARKQECKISLEKKNVSENIIAMVRFFIDKSGSMSPLYKRGIVQDTFERLLPLADILDDNHEMEVYGFNESCVIAGNAKVDNAEGFIDRAIRVGGGTNYSPIIKAAIKSANPKVPTFAIIVTDGDCWDPELTEDLIKEASKLNIFFQFVGIGDEHFKFLEKLDTMSGRYIDNAGFFKIKDLTQISDKDLYDLLVSEFPTWLANYKTPNTTQTIETTQQKEETKKKGFFGKLFGK